MKKEGFVESVAAYLLECNNGNFEQVTLILPNYRSAALLKKALSSRAPRLGLLPRFLLMDEWVAKLSKMQVASEFELLFPLYEHYAGMGGHLPLEQFFATGRMMLQDFSDMDMALVDAVPFFKDLYALKSLNVFEPGIEENAIARDYLHFWDSYRSLYFELGAQMKSMRKGYKGFLYRTAAEADWPEALFAATDRFFAIGFSNLGKADERLFDRLHEQFHLEWIADYDRYYTADRNHEAGYFYRKFHDRWYTPERFLPADRLSSKPITITGIGVSGKTGQSAVVSDLLGAAGHNGLEEVLLVVADDKHLGFVLSQLPPGIARIDLSMSYPVMESQTADFIQLWMRLQQEIQWSRAGIPRFYQRSLLRLLAHPFLQICFPGKPELLSSKMRKENLTYVSRELLLEVMGAHAEVMFPIGKEASEMYEAFFPLLQMIREVLSHSAFETSELEQACLNQCLVFLEELKDWMNRLGKSGLSVKSFAAWVTDFLRTAKIPYESEAGNGLQVCGLYETRMSSARKVIVLGANEGILPAGKSEHSYLPAELKRAWMPGYQEKDATVSYLFYRLFHEADEVYLLFNTAQEGIEKSEKSRFILQIREEFCKHNSRAVYREELLALALPPLKPGETIAMEKTPEVMEKLKRLCERGLSPSAINTAVNCNLQFYFRYLAGIKEAEELEESLEANTLGSAVHYALEKFYARMPDGIVQEQFLQEALEDPDFSLNLIRENLLDSFEAESLEAGKNHLLLHVGKQLVKNFIAYDLERTRSARAQGLEYQVLEQEKRLSRGVEINGIKVQISGIVDRVELMGKVVRIADFKTGRYDTSKLETAAPEKLFSNPEFAKSLQVLTYAWMYFGDEAHVPSWESFIYWLRQSPDKLAAGFSVGEGLQSSLQPYREELVLFLSKLLDPTEAFRETSDAKRCAFCDFIAICKREGSGKKN